MRSLFFVIFLLIQGASVFAQDTTMTKHYVDEILTTTKIEKTNCSKIDSIVEMALSKKGCSYKYGGIGPNSFDCSGLMYHTFAQFGITLLRSSRDQYTMGVPVKKENIRRGDLVFFKRGKEVGHVGIVIEVDSKGDYSFVHASTYNTGVRVDISTREGYVNTFVGARRLIDCNDPNLLLSSEKEIAAVHTDTTANVVQTVSEESTKKTASQKEEKTKKWTNYRVKQGDTLYAISKKYKISINDIKKWNNLKSDKISIGQRLKIYK